MTITPPTSTVSPGCVALAIAAAFGRQVDDHRAGRHADDHLVGNQHRRFLAGDGGRRDHDVAVGEELGHRRRCRR